MVESTSSCGNISCPSTGSSPAPDAQAEPPVLGTTLSDPMPKLADPATPPCDGGALLRELDRMRTLIAARAASRGGFSLRKGERLLVVARFAPGLTLEAWNALSRDGLDVPTRDGEPFDSMDDAVPSISRPHVSDVSEIQTTSSSRTSGAGVTSPAGTSGAGVSGAGTSGATGISGQGPWFVLDLDPAQHPQLASLCQGGTHLFHAICPLTGALLPEPFRKHLIGELERLTDGGELSLILLELVTPAWMKVPCAHGGQGASNPHEFAGLTSPFSHTALDFAMSSLTRVVRPHIRACDTPGRLGVDRLALVLPATGPFRARALAERLIGDFCETIAAEYGTSTRKKRSSEDLSGVTSGAAPSSVPPIELRAGIACCDGAQGLTPEVLLGDASTALTLARPGHTRTFRKAGVPGPERKTQVQACEKQFLFFGDPE